MSSPKSGDQTEAFLELSRILTGDPRLDVELGKEYYLRIKRAFGAALKTLLATYEALDGTAKDVQSGVGSQILSDEVLGAVAKEIIMLWYMAGFQVPKKNEPGETTELGPENPEQYFRGLFWTTVRAHPLGLSGGYFGYWRYPPEN